eukprot:CAMPEP_0203869780 /NCGR_PEP_ID=MMETSP0359-20131031/17902_1 /ASSEMBLY_ACC=CAM_ASM_000338 /TAXON_ID=268821 /ORGANISM="Scrippsiella Hangoei, Strain SHTV-5" /LENGTH=35 /DNA_ID= /DNA_START= /DNA_END= /DNA_ORIENTATION=
MCAWPTAMYNAGPGRLLAALQEPRAMSSCCGDMEV